MNASLQRLFAEYERTLHAQRFRAEDLDLGRLDYHLPLLERLDAVEDSSPAVSLPPEPRGAQGLQTGLRLSHPPRGRAPDPPAAAGGRAGAGRPRQHLAGPDRQRPAARWLAGSALEARAASPAKRPELPVPARGSRRAGRDPHSGAGGPALCPPVWSTCSGGKWW